MEIISGRHIAFLDRIFSGLSEKGIDVHGFELDHICYRVEVLQRYELLKNQLSKVGTLIGESIIGGRKIANFRLDEPLIYKDRDIYVVEVPGPKPSSFYKEGFEHVEFVVDLDLAKFAKRYSHLDFDESGMKKATNRDLRIFLGDISVKFHEQSLESIIAGE